MMTKKVITNIRQQRRRRSDKGRYTGPFFIPLLYCSYECAADCEHCVTQPSTEQFW